MSTCMVDKATVIAACKLAKKDVIRRRRESWLSCLKHEMREKKRWFFGKPYRKTLKEAIEILKHFEYFDKDWRHGWWGQQNKANKILSVCRICLCEEVNLDFKDAEFIANFTPRK